MYFQKERSSTCQICQKPEQDFDNSSSELNFFRCGTPILRSSRCGYETLTINYLMSKFLMSAFQGHRYYSRH